MAEKIFVKRNLFGALVPADARSEEVIKSLPFEKWLTAQISQPRNVKHNAKYWTLLSKVFANQEHFKSVDDLHTCIKVATGYSVTYQLKNGKKVVCPASISFAKMSQQDFNKFYEEVVQFITTEVIPGLNSRDLEREIEGF
jgi:hypothetical protein